MYTKVPLHVLRLAFCWSYYCNCTLL